MNLFGYIALAIVLVPAAWSVFMLVLTSHYKATNAWMDTANAMWEMQAIAADDGERRRHTDTAQLVA